MTTKTKLEIIEETAAFYNSGNRSLKAGSCAYLGVGGARCAFSRCCVDSPKVNQLLKDNNIFVSAFELFEYAEGEGIDILKTEYSGHGSDFWSELQTFHDVSEYWDEKGLTEKGMEKKMELIAAFA